MPSMPGIHISVKIRSGRSRSISVSPSSASGAKWRSCPAPRNITPIIFLISASSSQKTIVAIIPSRRGDYRRRLRRVLSACDR